MKVTVVGAGAVGASCAEYIAIKNFVSEVVLLDIKENFELNSKNILIIGFGRIGKKLIKRCLGFDLNVNVFDLSLIHI